MSTTYLKIKITSLAAESKQIRAEEKRLILSKGDNSIREGLYLHRIHDVRSESRSALLAYGFLRGKKYRCIERKCHVHPDWKRVFRLASKFSDLNIDEAKERIIKWSQEE